VPLSSAFVALGSNLGDRAENLKAAVDSLRELGDVRAISPIYETAPVGFLAQPDFLNAVALLDTPLTPEGLLAALLRIERSHGRDRQHAIPKGPRTLDLDLLDYDGQVLKTPRLTLPHPGLENRAFVLRPLLDLAPDWRHPVLHQGAAELLRALPERDPAQAVRLFRRHQTAF
jgi:2-amino-4-hydroxy-6-hydroxymethyldihydropteridine diphosphokinase